MLAPLLILAAATTAPASGPARPAPPPNRPPHIDSSNSLYARRHEQESWQVTASDPDGDPLTLTATGLPAGADLIPGDSQPPDRWGVSHIEWIHASAGYTFPAHDFQDLRGLRLLAGLDFALW